MALYNKAVKFSASFWMSLRSSRQKCKRFVVFYDKILYGPHESNSLHHWISGVMGTSSCRSNTKFAPYTIMVKRGESLGLV